MNLVFHTVYSNTRVGLFWLKYELLSSHSPIRVRERKKLSTNLFQFLKEGGFLFTFQTN